MRQLVLAALVAMSACSLSQTFFEGFENVGGTTTNGQFGGANLEAQGWFLQNNSWSLGVTGWYQNPWQVLTAHTGTGYIAANYHNVGNGTISNWLVTPSFILKNGTAMSFYTRTVPDTMWPDRLEVRLSTNGNSTDVGTGPTSVGDFTTLLLTINPDLEPQGYPLDWTKFTVTVQGLEGPTLGKFALRYFVTGAGSGMLNGNYIGIDTLQLSNWIVPEPSLLAVSLVGLGYLRLRRRRA